MTDMDGPAVSRDASAASVTSAVALTGAGTAVAGAEYGRPLMVVPLSAAQLALYAGWTMAVLHGRVPATTGNVALPTVHELGPAQRRAVELGRLQRLLERLAERPGCAGLAQGVSVMNAADPDFSASLEGLHLSILEQLAAAGLELELAYELGRSLRDTANPPQDAGHAGSPAEPLAWQLRRARVAQLQEWLAALSAEFPAQVSAIVAASLGRWSDFAEVTVGGSARLRRGTDGHELAARMGSYLLQQGDVWLMLLIGTRSTKGLLTPEGYVAAGEAALRRSATLIRGVLAHYWAVLACIAAALGGVLYLAVTLLGGAAQAWTSIAAIASALGASARSVTATLGRLTAEAEKPVFAVEEEEVKAWAITTMPSVDLTSRGVKQLRKAGVTKTVSLGRV
jgi:hypothetical protein